MTEKLSFHPNHFKHMIENIPFADGEIENIISFCLKESKDQCCTKVYSWGGMFDLMISETGVITFIPNNLRSYKLDNNGYLEQHE